MHSHSFSVNLLTTVYFRFISGISSSFQLVLCLYVAVDKFKFTAPLPAGEISVLSLKALQSIYSTCKGPKSAKSTHYKQSDIKMTNFCKWSEQEKELEMSNI